jgi:hypothetical protein
LKLFDTDHNEARELLRGKPGAREEQQTPQSREKLIAPQRAELYTAVRHAVLAASSKQTTQDARDFATRVIRVITNILRGEQTR